MIRLLVQFKSYHEFGGNNLELLGLYKDPDEAVKDGLTLFDDTVDCMLIQIGSKYLQIR